MFIHLDTGARYSLYLEYKKTPSMTYLALTKFAALSLAAVLFIPALACWWSPPPAGRGQRPRVGVRLPLYPYRILFYVIFGEVTLLSLSLVNLAAAT